MSYTIYNPGQDFHLTSGFGWRTDPFSGNLSWHQGQDYSAVKGAPIPSGGDGVVFYSGSLSGYGNCVVVKHESNGLKFYTLYGHLNEPSSLVVNQNVCFGDIVGFVGNTGTSQGYHLHFEIIMDQTNPLSKGHYNIDPGFEGGGVGSVYSATKNNEDGSYTVINKQYIYDQLVSVTITTKSIDGSMTTIKIFDGSGSILKWNMEEDCANGKGSYQIEYNLEGTIIGWHNTWISSDGITKYSENRDSSDKLLNYDLTRKNSLGGLTTNYREYDPNGPTDNSGRGPLTSSVDTTTDKEGNKWVETKSNISEGSTLKYSNSDGTYAYEEKRDKDGKRISSDSTRIDPDGKITTTHIEYNPDGSINKKSITETNPDGSTTTKDEENPTPPVFPPSPPVQEQPIVPPPPEPPPPPPRCDPLVVDLGGDGILTEGLSAGIHFDHEGDGFRELSGFVNAEDGLLVLDRNGDGQINDGSELFGDNTRLLDGTLAANGFAALSEMDDDKDGVIDKNDTVFSQLRLFQDLNQNGQTDAGELFSLEEKRIAGLHIAYQDSSYVDKFGNAHRQLGSYMMEDGETRSLTDVVFATNLTFTETNQVVEPVDIVVLPDAVGYGKTYSLHQAMARDDSGRLKELVWEFVDCTDRATRLSLVKDIVYAWTGQDLDLATDTVKKINVLDSFYGATLGSNWLRALNRFDQVLDTVWYQLMRSTHLAPLFDNVSYTLDSASNTYIGNYDRAIPVLAGMLEQDPVRGEGLVLDFIQAIRGINPYNTLNQNALRTGVQSWLTTQPTLSAVPLALMSSLAAGATDQNDTITGSAQADLLYGLTGNDTIFAMDGDDVLVGGEGNDLLQGGSGNDTYQQGRGFGQDRIDNLDTMVGRCDKIEFVGDIRPDDLVFSRAADDLIINIVNSSDQLRIVSHF